MYSESGPIVAGMVQRGDVESRRDWRCFSVGGFLLKKTVSIDRFHLHDSEAKSHKDIKRLSERISKGFKVLMI